MFFDPEYPSEPKVKPDGASVSVDRRQNGRPSNGRSNSRNSQARTQKPQVAPPPPERSSSSSDHGSANNNSHHDWREGSSVLDLNGDNYFSCAVGRKRSNARYLLNSSEDVVSFLKEMAESTTPRAGGLPPGAAADYMFLDRQYPQ